jgi:methylated-DNA-[protein]-cysteine S-methyltransferase
MKESVGYYKCPIGIVEIKSEVEELISIKILDSGMEIPTSEKEVVIELAIVQLDEYFNKKRKSFDLPLRFVGTDYQVSVWKAVYEIPYGQTRTYSEIASIIGSQKSVRAAGAANGQNPFWIIVPCHRVVGADGSLTGYAGGLWRKQWLLEHENVDNRLPFQF